MAFADVWMKIASSEVGAAVTTAAALPLLPNPRLTGLPPATPTFAARGLQSRQQDLKSLASGGLAFLPERAYL
jgi:hypothetical protein